MKNALACLLLLVQFNPVYSQFTGGLGSGHAYGIALSSISIYTGGRKDGYHSKSLINNISIYAGLNKDGHAIDEWTSNQSIYQGGRKDGYHHNKFKNSISIYTGSTEDGYVTKKLTSNISIYQGGEKDGYALGKIILSYIWTGIVDEDWNKKENWSLTIIPHINSNVIIPRSVPNFPHLNAGIMSVGQNPNGGSFLCKRINIQSGAQLTYSAAAFLENYGLLEIRGSVYVFNSDLNAFVTHSGGKLIIYDLGILEFQ